MRLGAALLLIGVGAAHTLSVAATAATSEPSVRLTLPSSIPSAADAPALVCPIIPSKKTKIKPPVQVPNPSAAAAPGSTAPGRAEDAGEYTLTPPSADELDALGISPTAGMAAVPSSRGASAPIGTGSGSPFSGSPFSFTALGTARSDVPYKIAVWGDSHMAAGFFTDELIALLSTRSIAQSAGQVTHQWLPASIGRAGVRLPVKKSCVSPGWRYETAATQANLGPGLINMHTAQNGAWLALDFRATLGAQAQSGMGKLSVLYRPTSTAQIAAQLRISINGGEPYLLHLPPASSSAHTAGRLDIASALEPIATVRIEVTSGEFTLHGLTVSSAANDAPAPRLQLDLFGIPGATASGWQQASPAYLSQWFSSEPYDLVMLAYGTNEGNQSPFSIAQYETSLRQTLRAMRQQMPHAACLLLAPGDRGVLIRRSKNSKPSQQKSSALKNKIKRSLAPSYSKTDLLRYSRIHEAIGQVQSSVGAEFACQTWSALDAMGGAGSAYAWQRLATPLMANDLIHFTSAGYRELARRFAESTRWSELFQAPR